MRHLFLAPEHLPTRYLPCMNSTGSHAAPSLLDRAIYRPAMLGTLLAAANLVPPVGGCLSTLAPALASNVCVARPAIPSPESAEEVVPGVSEGTLAPSSSGTTQLRGTIRSLSSAWGQLTIK